MTRANGVDAVCSWLLPYISWKSTTNAVRDSGNIFRSVGLSRISKWSIQCTVGKLFWIPSVHRNIIQYLGKLVLTALYMGSVPSVKSNHHMHRGRRAEIGFLWGYACRLNNTSSLVWNVVRENPRTSRTTFIIANVRTLHLPLQILLSESTRWPWLVLPLAGKSFAIKIVSRESPSDTGRGCTDNTSQVEGRNGKRKSGKQLKMPTV